MPPGSFLLHTCLLFAGASEPINNVNEPNFFPIATGKRARSIKVHVRRGAGKNVGSDLYYSIIIYVHVNRLIPLSLAIKVIVQTLIYKEVYFFISCKI